MVPKNLRSEGITCCLLRRVCQHDGHPNNSFIINSLLIGKQKPSQSVDEQVVDAVQRVRGWRITTTDRRTERHEVLSP